MNPFENMTQRIEPFFHMSQWIGFFEWTYSKNWTFFEYDSIIWTFFSMWFKYLSLIFKLTHRFFSHHWTFFGYDSHHWTFWIRLKDLNFFFLIWLQELNTFSLLTQWIQHFFSYMTLRIQPFFWKWLIEINLFLIWLTKWNLFFSFLKWLKELMDLFLNITNRAVFEDESKNWTFLENVTRRILFLKITKHFFEKTQRINLWFYDSESKNWTFFLNVTQRIPFVKYDSNGTFFQIWHEELNFFLSLTQRIELFFFEHDTKNWKPFISWIWRLDLDLFFKIWRKELNYFWKFFWYDSKIWTHFVNMTQRIEFKKKTTQRIDFQRKTTQRIELFLFWLRLKEWNSFLIWLEVLNFSNKKLWLQEFFFLKKNMTQRIEPFFEWQKMEFFWKTLRNELFWTLLEELNPFYYVFKNSTPFKKNDSKNWPLLQYDSKILFFKYDSNFFCFEYDSENWTFFSIWHKGLNLFVECDSIQPFFNVIQKVFLQKWL